MARKIDKQSTRQKAFAFLDRMMEHPRSDVVLMLKTRFEIGQSYAMTLYQNHRRNNIVSGGLTKVFRVKDRRDGHSVDPFMSSSFIASVTPNDNKTESRAINRYVRDLSHKTKKALKL